jgi:hypothetical protein
MNPINKENYWYAGLTVLSFVAIVLITLAGRGLPEISLLFSIPLLLFTFMVLMAMPYCYSARILNAVEIKLVLRDYPELKSWVESLLNKRELVTLSRLRRVITKNKTEEAEKQRMVAANSLLEEQRKAIINSRQITSQ